ncbi:MAG: DUF393 domain-containing protein [Pseudomonadota bacterium]
MNGENKNQSIVLFDGVCNLCNGFVQFIIKHEKKNKLMFASLQSEAAKKILVANNENPAQLNSVVLIIGNKVYKKSTAGLYILSALNGLYPMLFVFIIIPPSIRDFVYDIIAKYRYKWFGIRESCMIPTKELKEKFLN